MTGVLLSSTLAPRPKACGPAVHLGAGCNGPHQLDTLCLRMTGADPTVDQQRLRRSAIGEDVAGGQLVEDDTSRRELRRHAE